MRRGKADVRGELLVLSGPNNLEAALDAGLLPTRVAVSEAPSARLAALLKRAPEARTLSRDALTEIVGHPQHQGLIFELRPKAAPPLKHFLSQARCRLLVLDQIQDPHNFGAIARSAWGLGIDALVVGERRQAPLSDTALRASAGTLLKLPVCEVTNLARTLGELKQADTWVLGLDAQGQPLERAEALREHPRLALVVGNEGRGLRPLVRDSCDLCVALPMLRSLDSLNASVATGIALFWLQDGSKHPPEDAQAHTEGPR